MKKRNHNALESERRRQFDAEQRINHGMATSADPMEREAAALITRMGRSWYYTEGQARQVALFAAKELVEAKEAMGSVPRYSIGVSLDGDLEKDVDSTGEWVRYEDLTKKP